MIFNNPVDIILGQASKIKLLRFMIRTDAEMNGRELAKAVNLSHVKCHTALQELSKHGLIINRKVGSSIVYKLEKEHILYKDFLMPLFNKETTLYKSLANIIINAFKIYKPINISVFGSNVKGTAKPDSDIDLLVIIPNSKVVTDAQNVLDKVEETISAKFGNQLSPIVIQEKDFKKKCKDKIPLYMEILKNNIVIYGKDIVEVL